MSVLPSWAWPLHWEVCQGYRSLPPAPSSGGDQQWGEDSEPQNCRESLGVRHIWKLVWGQLLTTVTGIFIVLLCLLCSAALCVPSNTVTCVFSWTFVSWTLEHSLQLCLVTNVVTTSLMKHNSTCNRVIFQHTWLMYLCVGLVVMIKMVEWEWADRFTGVAEPYLTQSHHPIVRL